MPVEDDIAAVIRAAVPRVAPDFLPTTTERPYAFYSQFGGEALGFIDKSIPNKENGQFQIEVWADTRTEAKAKIKEIEAAMIAATAFEASPVAAPSSDSDPDMKRYCCRQDWSVWSDR